MSPYEFINRMFEAKAVKNCGIVRRKISSIEKRASVSYLVKEVDARGFHLIETGDQFLVVCNAGNFKLWR